jgi:muramoyltetrapeptide carboxypeptidase
MRYEFSESQVVSEGSSEGVLFGGCLSLSVALIGTPYDFWIPDGVWFWEDVDEPAYRVDRMLTHLKLSGRFKNLRGVMIGKLKACGGGDERELASLLDEFFTASNIPVVRDLPFGHHGDNLLLPIGARVRLNTQQRFFEFPEPAIAVNGDR